VDVRGCVAEIAARLNDRLLQALRHDIGVERVEAPTAVLQPEPS
jgi:hypothetical protein